MQITTSILSHRFWIFPIFERRPIPFTTEKRRKPDCLTKKPPIAPNLALLRNGVAKTHFRKAKPALFLNGGALSRRCRKLETIPTLARSIWKRSSVMMMGGNTPHRWACFNLTMRSDYLIWEATFGNGLTLSLMNRTILDYTLNAVQVGPLQPQNPSICASGVLRNHLRQMAGRM